MQYFNQTVEEEESIVIGEDENMRLSYLSNIEQEFYNKPYKQQNLLQKYKQEYNIQLQRGNIVHKRIKYTNIHKRVLLLKAITDQPNLLQFKSSNNTGLMIELDCNCFIIIFLFLFSYFLQQPESDYLRLKFTPPNNPCIIIARVALLDHLDSNQAASNQSEKDQFALINLKQKMIEGLEFRVEIV